MMTLFTTIFIMTAYNLLRLVYFVVNTYLKGLLLATSLKGFSADTKYEYSSVLQFKMTSLNKLHHKGKTY